MDICVDGRKVGHVLRDTFYKVVRASIHFLRKPPAICFDTQSLDDAERAGAQFVEVTDAETNRLYRASIRRIRIRGFRVARGYGEQRALTLNEFNQPSDDDLDPPAPTTTKTPTQLALWSKA